MLPCGRKPIIFSFRRLQQTAMGALLTVVGITTGTGAIALENTYLNVSVSFPAPSGAKDLCETYSWACATVANATVPNGQELRLVSDVNSRVNRTTRTIEDQTQYRKAEEWALPTSRGGDCEDFALLKKHELIRLGLDPRKLLLATVLDTRRNSHAVLVYRSVSGDLVLDNLTNRIKPWRQTGYVFLRMQDPRQPQKWVAINNSG